MDREPIVTVAAITAVVSAALGVLVAFGLPLPEGAGDAIMVFVGAVAPLVVAWVARGRVTSPATLRAMTTPQKSTEPPA